MQTAASAHNPMAGLKRLIRFLGSVVTSMEYQTEDHANSVTCFVTYVGTFCALHSHASPASQHATLLIYVGLITKKAVRLLGHPLQLPFKDSWHPKP